MLIEIQSTQEALDTLYTKGSIPLDEKLSTNQCVLLYTGNQSALCIYREGSLHKANGLEKELQGIKGKDARQKLMISLLVDDKIPLVVATGRAGTGKTLLAVAYALSQYTKMNKDIILIKPSVFVGGKSQVLGILPGTLEEKFEAVMASYMVHFRALLGQRTQEMVYDMTDKGKLQILPIETARGMNLANAVVIVDEAQNLDIHSLKTLISRVASTSKLILLGDLKQVDIANTKYNETGLFKLINSETFTNSNLTANIQLTAAYRSPLCDFAEEWGDEMENE